MNSKYQIVDRPAQPTVLIRTRSSVRNLPATLGDAYGKIMAYLGEKGVYPSYAGFVGYFNMDMEDLELEIGFPVNQPVEGSGEILFSEIPACKAATTVHHGPYDELSTAYDALNKLIEEQGETASGIAYEFYLNDPREVAPEELQTEIVLPLT